MTFWSTARRCARPGRVWGCGRSAGRSDSCASREPPLQDWLDNWQPRGTPCDPMSSRACKPHLNPARFAGVRVPRVDERRVAPPRPTPIGPTSSPASRTTRGKDHPTARSSGPGPGQVWHRVQELAGRARKRLPCGGANRDARSPSRDSNNAIAYEPGNCPRVTLGYRTPTEAFNQLIATTHRHRRLCTRG